MTSLFGERAGRLESKIVGIVLAAGTSTRFGRNKLLLPLGPKAVVAWAVENAMAAPLAEVLVVTGCDREEVETALKDRPVRLVHNPDFQRGQSTSLKAGVQAARGASAYLFLLGDQPLIPPEVMGQLVLRFRDGAPLIVVPTFQGRRGNPTLMSALLREELLGLEGDQGARALIEAHEEAVTRVEVSTPAIHMDIDREEDYQACLKLFELWQPPAFP